DHVRKDLLPRGKVGLRDRRRADNGKHEVLRVERREDHSGARCPDRRELVERLIHFGVFTSSLSRGLRRHCRSAPTSSRSPTTRTVTDIHVAGSTCSRGEPTSLATERRIAPTLARPITQPRMNAGPFTRPRVVASMSTTATIGSGLIATPIALGSIWPSMSSISTLETGSRVAAGRTCRGEPTANPPGRVEVVEGHRSADDLGLLRRRKRSLSHQRIVRSQAPTRPPRELARPRTGDVTRLARQTCFRDRWLAGPMQHYRVHRYAVRTRVGL